MVCKYSFLDNNTYQCSRVGGECRTLTPDADICEIAQIPTGEDALHAAQTIKRFCVRRSVGSGCENCVLYSFCNVPPYAWAGASKAVDQ